MGRRRDDRGRIWLGVSELGAILSLAHLGLAVVAWASAAVPAEWAAPPRPATMSNNGEEARLNFEQDVPLRVNIQFRRLSSRTVTQSPFPIAALGSHEVGKARTV